MADEGGPASVDELIEMMNKRPGTRAAYATGDSAAMLRKMEAEGSHFLDEAGNSDILLREDVATRHAAMHEWLHRVLQRRNGGPMPGEDQWIEEFLERHRVYLRLDQ